MLKDAATTVSTPSFGAPIGTTSSSSAPVAVVTSSLMPLPSSVPIADGGAAVRHRSALSTSSTPSAAPTTAARYHLPHNGAKVRSVGAPLPPGGSSISSNSSVRRLLLPKSLLFGLLLLVACLVLPLSIMHLSSHRSLSSHASHIMAHAVGGGNVFQQRVRQAALRHMTIDDLRKLHSATTATLIRLRRSLPSLGSSSAVDLNLAAATAKHLLRGLPTASAAAWSRWTVRDVSGSTTPASRYACWLHLTAAYGKCPLVAPPSRYDATVVQDHDDENDAADGGVCETKRCVERCVGRLLLPLIAIDKESNNNNNKSTATATTAAFGDGLGNVCDLIHLLDHQTADPQTSHRLQEAAGSIPPDVALARARSSERRLQDALRRVSGGYYQSPQLRTCGDVYTLDVGVPFSLFEMLSPSVQLQRRSKTALRCGAGCVASRALGSSVKPFDVAPLATNNWRVALLRAKDAATQRVLAHAMPTRVGTRDENLLNVDCGAAVPSSSVLLKLLASATGNLSRAASTLGTCRLRRTPQPSPWLVRKLGLLSRAFFVLHDTWESDASWEADRTEVSPSSTLRNYWQRHRRHRHALKARCSSSLDEKDVATHDVASLDNVTAVRCGAETVLSPPGTPPMSSRSTARLPLLRTHRQLKWHIAYQLRLQGGSNTSGSYSDADSDSDYDTPVNFESAMESGSTVGSDETFEATLPVQGGYEHPSMIPQLPPTLLLMAAEAAIAAAKWENVSIWWSPNIAKGDRERALDLRIPMVLAAGAMPIFYSSSSEVDTAASLPSPPFRLAHLSATAGCDRCMPTMPKAMLQRAHELRGLSKTPQRMTVNWHQFDLQQYRLLLTGARQHARRFMTTRSMVAQVLSVTDADARSVLVHVPTASGMCGAAVHALIHGLLDLNIAVTLVLPKSPPSCRMSHQLEHLYGFSLIGSTADVLRDTFGLAVFRDLTDAKQSLVARQWRLWTSHRIKTTFVEVHVARTTADVVAVKHAVASSVDTLTATAAGVDADASQRRSNITTAAALPTRAAEWLEAQDGASHRVALLYTGSLPMDVGPLAQTVCATIMPQLGALFAQQMHWMQWTAVGLSCDDADGADAWRHAPPRIGAAVAEGRRALRVAVIRTRHSLLSKTHRWDWALRAAQPPSASSTTASSSPHPLPRLPLPLEIKGITGTKGCSWRGAARSLLDTTAGVEGQEMGRLEGCLLQDVPLAESDLRAAIGEDWGFPSARNRDDDEGGDDVQHRHHRRGGGRLSAPVSRWRGEGRERPSQPQRQQQQQQQHVDPTAAAAAFHFTLPRPRSVRHSNIIPAIAAATGCIVKWQRSGADRFSVDITGCTDPEAAARAKSMLLDGMSF